MSFGFRILLAIALFLMLGGSALAAGGQHPGPVPSNAAVLVPGDSVDGNSSVKDAGNSHAAAINDDENAAEEQYGNDGSDNDNDNAAVRECSDDDAAGNQYCVTAVARDKTAVGTRTLPNGDVIENHGMAMSQAAREQHEEDNATVAPAPPMPAQASHASVPPHVSAPSHPQAHPGQQASGMEARSRE